MTDLPTPSSAPITEKAAPAKPLQNRSLRRKQAARIAAIHALYEAYFNAEAHQRTVDAWAEDILTRHKDASERNDPETSLKEQPERAMLLTLLESARLHHAAIEKYIENSMGERWKAERMGALLTAIVQAGIAELLAKRDKNSAIIISEYVNIAENYCDEAETGFVNGILATIAQKIRQES